MRRWIRISGRFFRRDLAEVSRRAFLETVLRAVAFTAVWAVLTGWLGRSTRVLTAGYEMDYFTFSLIGLGLARFGTREFSAVVGRLRALENGGFLDAARFGAVPASVVLLGTGSGQALLSFVHLGSMLLAGSLFFGAQLTPWEALLVTGVGLANALPMRFLGMLWTGSDLGTGWKLQRLQTAFVRFLFLSNGVIFPVARFPEWLQRLALCFPLTHALNLARGWCAALPAEWTVGAEIEWLAVTVAAGAVGSAVLEWGTANRARKGDVRDGGRFFAPEGVRPLKLKSDVLL